MTVSKVEVNMVKTTGLVLVDNVVNAVKMANSMVVVNVVKMTR